MYCIILNCIVLYCIVLYCIVLYCIVLYCIVLYCIVLYCIVLYCIVLYCIVLYCIVLYCIVLYCIVLHYIVYSINVGERPRVKTAASLFRKMCYYNRDYVVAGIICAGWDPVVGGQVEFTFLIGLHSLTCTTCISRCTVFLLAVCLCVSHFPLEGLAAHTYMAIVMLILRRI